MALTERYQSLEGRTITFVGDGNNILHSLLLLLPQLGVRVQYACPEKYQPDPLIVEQAIRTFGNNYIAGYTDPKEAVRGSDAIYTDVWTSMGFEDEIMERKIAFQSYQVNAKLLSLAKPYAAVMHCLPLVRGEEITAEAIEHRNSIIFHQSENRLHIMKALLMKLYSEDPSPWLQNNLNA
jgi:ornithine carbamoyltransferase